jgi:hypothetical protein
VRKKIVKKTHTITLFTISLFVLCLVPSPGIADAGAADVATEGVGHLKGFIYKKNGKTPLWGVQVLLKNVETGQVFESNVTDNIGDYEVRDVPAGNYTIFLLRKDKDYKIKKVDFLISIAAGKTTNISFALKKSKFFFLWIIDPCIIWALIAAAAAVIVGYTL